MKRFFSLLLALTMLGLLCACGTENDAPSLSEAAAKVMEMIDAIPEMAEDGSNADAVYEAYTAAQKEYFALSYDDMGKISNVGIMWKASDDVFNVNMGGGEDYDYEKLLTEAGQLLQGVWYDSSYAFDPEYCFVIHRDGGVTVPYGDVQYLTPFTDGTYYIPGYERTVYPEYSMGAMRLADVDGRGCLIPKEIVDEMFVTVELTKENVADYICFDRIWSYLNEWGDTVNYSDENQTSYAALNRTEGNGLTYIGCRNLQVEVLLKGGKSTTFYDLGQFWIDGKDVQITDLGRAKGTLQFVKSEYVWKVEPDEYGGVTVWLNDGSQYYYYHGNFAFG